MAVSATPPLLKGYPEVEKLNQFSGYTVTVTRYQGARGGVGTMVVPTVRMAKLDQVLALQTSLPLKEGPGFYRFDVVDTGGTGNDAWMVKLGPDVPEDQMGVTPFPGTPAASAPLSENVRVIGRGYTYDENLHLLTTPWGKIYAWQPGEPLPDPPPATANAAAAGQNAFHASPWAAASPWNPAGMPFGWGGYPATSTSDDSARVKQLEAQVAEQNRRAEMDALRQEMRRQADETNARFEKLITAITEKPKGPDEAMLRMERQLEDEKRRREDQEREAARREEDRRRDEQHREEMRATKEMIREMSANRQDPMIPLIMQLMGQTQSQAMESVKAIRDATTTGTAASERANAEMVRHLSSQTLSPMQLVQFMQSMKSDGAEAARTIIDATRSAMEVQKSTYEQLLDVAGQGNQPAWLTAVDTIMQRVGPIGEMLANRAREQAAAPVQAQVVQPRPMPQPQAQQPRNVSPHARPVQQPQARPVAGSTAAPQRAVNTGERPDGAVFDDKTDEFVLPSGFRIARAIVADRGWNYALSAEAQAAARLNGAPASGPMNGASAGPTLRVVEEPEVIPPPAAAAPVAAPKKGGRKKKEKTPELPEPQGAGYTIEQLREMDPEVLLESFKPIQDDWLFGGPLLAEVEKLRARVAAGTVKPEEVASYVVQAQGYVQSMKLSPPIMDLLHAEQVEVFIDRLLPAASDDYRDAVIDALEETLGIESDDDDEEVAADA